MKLKTLKIGKRIKQLREQQGFTKERLAFENDLSKPTITRIERNEFDPKLSTLFKIANGLGVKITDLLSGLD